MQVTRLLSRGHRPSTLGGWGDTWGPLGWSTPKGCCLKAAFPVLWWSIACCSLITPKGVKGNVSTLCPDTLPGPCILLPYSSPLTGIQNPSPRHCLLLTFATCLINSPKAELSFRCTCPILYLQVNFQHPKHFSNQSFFRFFQQIFQVSKREEKLRIKFSLFIDSVSLIKSYSLPARTCNVSWHPPF